MDLAEQLRDGTLTFAIEDPDAPASQALRHLARGIIAATVVFGVLAFAGSGATANAQISDDVVKLGVYNAILRNTNGTIVLISPPAMVAIAR